jgi:hypothetical protein
MLFSTGVPVSAMRRSARNARAALACLVSAFLMFWASSRITTAHSTPWNNDKSRCSSP